MKKTSTKMTMTVVMTRIKVYRHFMDDDGEREEQIGYGWVFSTDYGMTEPELFTMNGSKLEQGWYHLVPEENDRLAVMTETIQ